MGNYTVNTHTSEWHVQNGIDFDLSVGVSGFYSDQESKFESIEWKDAIVSPTTLIKLCKSGGMELDVLNLSEVCKVLKVPDTIPIIKSRDVTNRYSKYEFQHNDKTVAVVSHITGVFVDNKRFRNVLSAFK